MLLGQRIFVEGQRINGKSIKYFKMPWLVVKFDVEDTVEAVPKNWYCDKTSTCYWPPDTCSSFTIEEKIRNQHSPDRSLWKTYPAVIFGQYGKLCLLMIWEYENTQQVLTQL